MTRRCRHRHLSISVDYAVVNVFWWIGQWFRQESHSKVQSLRQCNECCSIRSGDFDGDHPIVHECAADQTDCYLASNYNIMVAQW